MDIKKPLEGIRVVELANFVAAPSAGRMLTDWGAEVIHVESMAGDNWRTYGNNCGVPVTEQENPVFDCYNANKKSLQIDIKNPEGRAALLRLIGTADVFLTNNRPKALKRAGLDYETLKAQFPRLIFAHVTGYGQQGPDVDAPGFDGVAFFARSGLMVDLADPSGYPYTAPGCFGDAATGTGMFGAICAALYAREKTGQGDFLDVSLFGSANWMLACLMTFTQYGYKYPKERTEINPLVNCYRCSDGEWVQISVVDRTKWPVLAKALNIEYLLEDPRFCNGVVLAHHRPEIIPILEDVISKYDSVTLLKILAENDIVCSRLRHIKELASDPQGIANGYVRPFTFESGNSYMMPTPPLRSGNIGEMPISRGPLLGENTDEVLKSAGLTDEELAHLKEVGAIHQHD